MIQPTPNVHFHNNNSALFDGTNDHMTMAGLTNDIDSGAGSISMWVKQDSTSINNSYYKASVDSNNNIAITYINSAQVMRFQYKAGGTAEQIDSAFAFEGNNNWYHVVLTYDTTADGGNGEVKGYVNNAQAGSTQAIAGSFSGSISSVMTGKNTLADNSFVAGHVSQMTIWTTALTTAQIAQLYNGGTPGNPLMNSNIANLIGWYGFNEGSGTSVADLSGTGNTATFVNGTTFNTDTP